MGRREERKRLTAEITAARRKAAEHLRKHKAELKRADELRMERDKPAVKEPRRIVSARSQAGPRNVERMREVFQTLGRATAAVATLAAGYPPGHQVWAIRALEEEGAIRPTGRKVGRSKEYEFVRSRRRRVTRLSPGE